MNDWERFNKTSLPQKEEFYSKLNMEDIYYTFRLDGCKRSL